MMRTTTTLALALVATAVVSGAAAQAVTLCTGLADGTACFNASVPCVQTVCAGGVCGATGGAALATLTCAAGASIPAVANCTATPTAAQLANVTADFLVAGGAAPALTVTPAGPFALSSAAAPPYSVAVAGSVDVAYAGQVQTCPLAGCTATFRVVDAEPLNLTSLQCFTNLPGERVAVIPPGGKPRFTAGYLAKANGCPVTAAVDRSASTCQRCQNQGKKAKLLTFKCKGKVVAPATIELQALPGVDARVTWRATATDSVGTIAAACGVCIARPSNLTCADPDWQPGEPMVCLPPPAPGNSGKKGGAAPKGPGKKPPGRRLHAAA